MNKATKLKFRYRAGGDQVLQEIWRIKDALSASYGHDVSRMFSEARQNQVKNKSSKTRLRTGVGNVID
ncbi:MAG: hypothetical protein PHT59_07620 [Candidatus Omnitrophica bacterium]|nr:hypothetical protein [Candidatus Omnitrophota bacterium]